MSTTVASPARTDSAWAPLRGTVFRSLWLAVLASNIGTWMQTVALAFLAGPSTVSHLLPARPPAD
jgi:hypothetical protein